MTDAEKLLWSKIRGKQLKGVQFYRQKIIGNYIADFIAQRQGWSSRLTEGNIIALKGKRKIG